MKASWVAGGSNQVAPNVYLCLNRFAASTNYIANNVKSCSIMVIKKFIWCYKIYFITLISCLKIRGYSLTLTNNADN